MHQGICSMLLVRIGKVDTFNFLKYTQEEVTVISDGIITFIAHGYGDLVLQFFDPKAFMEKV